MLEYPITNKIKTQAERQPTVPSLTNCSPKHNMGQTNQDSCVIETQLTTNKILICLKKNQERETMCRKGARGRGDHCRPSRHPSFSRGSHTSPCGTQRWAGHSERTQPNGHSRLPHITVFVRCHVIFTIHMVFIFKQICRFFLLFVKFLFHFSLSPLGAEVILSKIFISQIFYDASALCTKAGGFFCQVKSSHLFLHTYAYTVRALTL